jgi:hypothetical protein
MLYHLSPRPVRHGPRQASQPSGTYCTCLTIFSCDAWRGPCLTGRGNSLRLLDKGSGAARPFSGQHSIAEASTSYTPQ